MCANGKRRAACIQAKMSGKIRLGATQVRSRRSRSTFAFFSILVVGL